MESLYHWIPFKHLLWFPVQIWSLFKVFENISIEDDLPVYKISNSNILLFLKYLTSEKLIDY